MKTSTDKSLRRVMTNHSHNTWEEVRECAGDFGPCWKNPHLAAIKVGGKDYSNKPPGRMVLRLIYLILLGLPNKIYKITTAQ